MADETVGASGSGQANRMLVAQNSEGPKLGETKTNEAPPQRAQDQVPEAKGTWNMTGDSMRTAADWEALMANVKERGMPYQTVFVDVDSYNSLLPAELRGRDPVKSTEALIGMLYASGVVVPGGTVVLLPEDNGPFIAKSNLRSIASRTGLTITDLSGGAEKQAAYPTTLKESAVQRRSVALQIVKRVKELTGLSELPPGLVMKIFYWGLSPMETPGRTLRSAINELNGFPRRLEDVNIMR